MSKSDTKIHSKEKKIAKRDGRSASEQYNDQIVTDSTFAFNNKNASVCWESRSPISKLNHTESSHTNASTTKIHYNLAVEMKAVKSKKNRKGEREFEAVVIVFKFEIVLWGTKIHARREREKKRERKESWRK